MESTVKILKHIFENHFLIHVNHLSKKLTLSNDLGMNEYEQKEMLIYVENTFKINIDDREVSKIRTVGDLVYYVEKQA